MNVELSVALNFLISHLYNRLPRRRVDVFREELETGFHIRFRGHWYPEDPSKGSAFRCVKLAGDKVDPVIDAAAKSSGLDIAEIKSYLPAGLTIWIDPHEVSYRVGEHGPVQVLYRSPPTLNGATSSSTSSPRGHDPESPEVGADALVWSDGPAIQTTAAIRPTDLTPVWAVPNTGVAASVAAAAAASTTCFTAATFAQTKFGSTKMKTHGPIRPSKLSPTAATAAGAASASAPDLLGLHVAAAAAAAAAAGTTRLSPTGIVPGRWNTLSPTAAAAGPGLLAPSTAGSLSPMIPAVPGSAAAASLVHHQFQQPSGASSASSLTPTTAGPAVDPIGVDWLLLQQRLHHQQQQQTAQIQSYLMAAAAARQQQQMRTAAPVGQLAYNGLHQPPVSSPLSSVQPQMTSSTSTSSIPYGYQPTTPPPRQQVLSYPQQNPTPTAGHQLSSQTSIQAHQHEYVKSPIVTGYNFTGFSTPGASDSCGLGRDSPVSSMTSGRADDLLFGGSSSSLSANFAHVDWSFDLASVMADAAAAKASGAATDSGSSAAAAAAGNKNTATGVHQLLMAN